MKLWRRLSEERGISTAVLAVTLIALFSAAVLSIDTGQLFSSRRNIITGTDASALHAANQFALGLLDPCATTDVVTAESGATNVLTENNPNALHNATDTPDGFEVTLADSTLCGSGSFVPGKVRFDGRLPSNQAFSSILGTGGFNAFSSSTAAWGYITAIGGGGLRPIAVCDQSSVGFPEPITGYDAAGPYPHYELWRQRWFGTISQQTYDSFFGIDDLPGNLDSPHYPSASEGFLLGIDSDNPNGGKLYIPPDSEGINGHHTVHRITMPEADCGSTPGNRIWVDFNGTTGGTASEAELRDQLLNGYDGTVSLTPHECNPSNEIPEPENCGSAPGGKPSLLKHALRILTCDVTIAAMSCPYKFPILVMNRIDNPGSTGEYHQVAFVFIVLRGFGKFVSGEKFQIDVEFIDLQVNGQVGPTPPSPSHPHQKGVMLCGADHDGGGDRCPF